MYSHCFGSNGACPGELSNPHGVTIDSSYVTDNYNDQAQMFTHEPGESAAMSQLTMSQLPS